MHRFFGPTLKFNSPVISITTPAEIHHLKNVLRLKSGDQLAIFNDSEEEVVGTIQTMTKDKVDVRMDYAVPKSVEAGPKIVLACAIPKKAKFEWIIEKTTELGVHEIIPLKTERTAFAIEGRRLEAKLARYKTVTVNAAKQSKRQSIPIIYPVAPLSSVLKNLQKEDCCIIASLAKGSQPILNLNIDFKAIKRVVLLVGPEGDFSPRETESALNANCRPVSLGPTVLKVDTAALVMVSWAQLKSHSSPIPH